MSAEGRGSGLRLPPKQQQALQLGRGGAGLGGSKLSMRRGGPPAASGRGQPKQQQKEQKEQPPRLSVRYAGGVGGGGGLEAPRETPLPLPRCAGRSDARALRRAKELAAEEDECQSRLAALRVTASPPSSPIHAHSAAPRAARCPPAAHAHILFAPLLVCLAHTIAAPAVHPPALGHSRASMS